jgi:Bacterial protein of unknown function (DUF899)
MMPSACARRKARQVADARKKLLAEEKELTRARDRVNADRRRLPMVRVDKPYTFEGPNGKVGLLDLFEGRLQLVMHHFMWLFDIDPDGNEIPRDDTCASCSSAAKRNGKNPKDARRRSACRPAAPTCVSPTNTTMPDIPQEPAPEPLTPLLGPDHRRSNREAANACAYLAACVDVLTSNQPDELRRPR